MTKEEREPMEIKYSGKIYKVHGVRTLPGGAIGYIIKDEPGHYDCIINPEEVLGDGGYGVKQNGSPYPTKEATFDHARWKPSKEQMKALDSAINYLTEHTCTPGNPLLISLYHDLQKLLQPMKYYKVLVDDQIVGEMLSYFEACELAFEIDNDPRYYWKTVDVVPMEDKQ